MKCHTCNKDGYQNLKEILAHKKECGKEEVKEIVQAQPIPNEPVVTSNADVEAMIEQKWNQPAVNTIKGEPIIAPEVVVDAIPEVAPAPGYVEEMKQKLSNIFQALKTSDAKSIVSRFLITSDLSKLSEQDIFNQLFSEITDGDERAVIRSYFV